MVVNPPATDCSACRQLKVEGRKELTFAVTTTNGGGWQQRTAVLLRLLYRVGRQPTQAMIISQPLVNDRFVQAMIGHGIALARRADRRLWIAWP